MMNLPDARSSRELARQEADRLPAQVDHPKPPTQTVGLTFWLYFLGFGIFGALGAWAAIGTIQGAVVAGGSFEVAGNLRVVDHLEGGIVSEILVEDGDFIEAGAVVARLDSSRVRAQIKILESQLATALSRHARLAAEAKGAAEITWPSRLESLVSRNPEFAEILKAQEGLFRTNRESDLGQVAIYDERISQLSERLRGIDDRIASHQSQLTLVQEDARTLEGLFEKGLARRDRVIERKEDEVVMMGRISDARSEREDVLRQVSEMREMQLQIQRQRRTTIAAEMEAVAGTIVDLSERIAATRDVLARTEIRAPESGIVLGITINTLGAVVEPGQRILQIVPEDSSYVIEARVSTGDIDEIEVGSPARVRLSSYSYRKVPPVEGEVTYISADTLFDSAMQENYYLVRVRLMADTSSLPTQVRPVPGMPVQVMVATTRQTILAHLLDPILGGLETAFVEGE